MLSARMLITKRLSSVALQKHNEDDKTSTSICNEARGFILCMYQVKIKSAVLIIIIIILVKKY